MTINQEVLHKIIEAYKEYFPGHIKLELYKWEAVKCFQDNWDIEAEDFADMYWRATEKAAGLLVSRNKYPRSMMRNFAKKEPDTVRGMFKALFEGSGTEDQRAAAFYEASDSLVKKYFPGLAHYQDYNTISIYMWLMYPDKYYIYKYLLLNTSTKLLEAPFKILKGDDPDRLKNCFEFFDLISEAARNDADIRKMLNSALTDDCDKDRMLHTAAIDINFFIARFYANSLNKDNEAKATTAPTPAPEPEIKDSYTKQDFLNDVFMTESEYDRLRLLLLRKKNIILQGAPGVGKTYCAKRLAYSMLNEKDESRVCVVQFHQNYSYEDFIMGYKPYENGFKLVPGVFYEFCKKAASNPGFPYFFIIDEINRGNLSKIFGELLMLIEKDYREKPIRLAYTNEMFCVPNNVLIIGMMNTADRSLALIDYALRRRFSFYEMKPGFDTEGFRNYQKKLDNAHFDKLIAIVERINKEVIAKDDSLGKGFEIGHSYFCNQGSITDEWLHQVIDFDLAPLLEEYWFDDSDKVRDLLKELNSIFND